MYELNRTWTCGACGFRNRAANLICGGGGHLGCKAPCDHSVAGLAVEAPPAVEAQVWVDPRCDVSINAAAMSYSDCYVDRQYIGILKSIGEEFSFIACTETAAIFQRDIYVCKHVLRAAFRNRTATSGVLVRFSVVLNDDGHPNARGVKLVGSVSESAGDRRFDGTVKYISEAKGYGFIESAEAFELYKSDVHVVLDDLKGCVLGQSVQFDIRLGQLGGRPQAQRLLEAGPPPTDMPMSYHGVAEQVLNGCWRRPVLLFGEGDLSFAVAAKQRHQGCQLDATVYLDEEQWRTRFPGHATRITDLQESGQQVRFGADATRESCAGYAAVFFNFPHLSVSEAQGKSDGVSPSGDLASKFLQNALATADGGTLLVLGLWSRCDGRPDAMLYGQDAHSLVSASVDASWKAGHNNVLTDALENGFRREGVHADYSLYESYVNEGYSFRTNVINAFESSHNEWHLPACFILKVVPRTGPAAWLDSRSGGAPFES